MDGTNSRQWIIYVCLDTHLTSLRFLIQLRMSSEFNPFEVTTCLWEEEQKESEPSWWDISEEPKRDQPLNGPESSLEKNPNLASQTLDSPLLQRDQRFSMSQERDLNELASESEPPLEYDLDREFYYDCVALYNRGLYRLCLKFLRRHYWVSDEYYRKGTELILDAEFELGLQAGKRLQYNLNK